MQIAMQYGDQIQRPELFDLPASARRQYVLLSTQLGWLTGLLTPSVNVRPRLAGSSMRSARELPRGAILGSPHRSSTNSVIYLFIHLPCRGLEAAPIHPRSALWRAKYKASAAYGTLPSEIRRASVTQCR
jgi:hypothetical protein